LHLILSARHDDSRAASHIKIEVQYCICAAQLFSGGNCEKKRGKNATAANKQQLRGKLIEKAAKIKGVRFSE
jgi:hypothetical protein